MVQRFEIPMNDFTRVFRQIAYMSINNGFKQEPTIADEKIDKLFKEAFPNEVDEDKIMMGAINSMQFVVGMFLMQIAVMNEKSGAGEEITTVLNGMGAMMINDLEEGDQK
jgi:hypothetical protein